MPTTRHRKKSENPTDEIIKTPLVRAFEYFKSKIIMIGSIAAAVASIFTVISQWDNLNLPRLAFYSEVLKTMNHINYIELSFYQHVRNEQADKWNKIQHQIEILRNQNTTIPDSMLDQLNLYERDVKEAERKLDDVRRRIMTPLPK